MNMYWEDGNLNSQSFLFISHTTKKFVLHIHTYIYMKNAIGSEIGICLIYPKQTKRKHTSQYLKYGTKPITNYAKLKLVQV